jgi:hypothetical protein
MCDGLLDCGKGRDVGVIQWRGDFDNIQGAHRKLGKDDAQQL